MSDDEDESTVIRVRKPKSQRSTAGQRGDKGGNRAAALEQIRKGERKLYDVSGCRRLHSSTLQESAYQAVVDEVDEDEYSELVRKRQKDDWIVDGWIQQFKFI